MTLSDITMITKTNKALRFTRGLGRWMVPPASNWQRKSTGAFIASGLYWPLKLLVLDMLFMIIITVSMPFVKYSPAIAASLIGISAFFALGMVLLIINRTKSNLLDPLTHMRHWATRIRGGHLKARIPVEGQGEFGELVTDINSLSENLHNLTTDMREQVRIQTERTAEKSKSLKTLYDVATSINNARDVNELLTYFLHTFKELVHAEAASIRLITDDNQLRLVAAIGLDDEFVRRERIIPIHRCDCGTAATQGHLRCQDMNICNAISQSSSFANTNMKMMAIPLKYRGKTLGIYNLFVQDSDLIEKPELKSLLNTIGQHLGVAIAKAQLENNTRRLALMEERTMLSHELHDSLAQTLASLRFQVHFMEKALSNDTNPEAHSELNKIKTGLEKGNYELRELLSHFRAPMDKRGLIPALSEMVNTLGKETGISTYFQDQTENQTLPPDSEVQVLHILQEILSNVRKHSKARNVRVVVKAGPDGLWQIFAEDDGCGFAKNTMSRKPGESIGLSIIRERTEKLHGQLNIESDENEGTRIEIEFQAAPQLFDQNLTNLLDLHPSNKEAI